MDSPKWTNKLGHPSNGSVPLGTSQDQQNSKTKRWIVPCRLLEIEGESFISISVDDNQPTSFEEAIKLSTSVKWIAAI